MLDGLMQGADRDLVKIWQKMCERDGHGSVCTRAAQALTRALLLPACGLPLWDDCELAVG